MAHRLAVAVSGGRDSAALLHATVAAARPLGIEVHAFHVHHGLMPEADGWQAQVARLCEACGVPLQLRRLTCRPARGDSIEAWARRERYAALTDMALQADVQLVLLAHHRRDQAETFLLQALRGAGPAGLAAMPSCIVRDGITWARPWLDQPREAIDAYVAHHRIAAVEDPSNADSRFARNRLRLQVMPGLSSAFADAESALAASARRMAEADKALRDWATQALARCSAGRALLREPWQALTPAQQAIVLRHWLALKLGQGAPQRLLDRLLKEWPDAVSASWPAGPGRMLRHYRGRLVLQAVPGEQEAGWPAALALQIDAPGDVAVPAWQGVLRVKLSDSGVPLAWLLACELRARCGGEQFQSAANRPPRSLKKMFQQQAVPAWARGAPLLWSAHGLMFVPGLGLDARSVNPAEAGPQVTLEWLPLAADSANDG
ncbi:MAG: tRNA lysidine(34) synthetase TilS [Aquincola tertiaricarbonis]